MGYVAPMGHQEQLRLAVGLAYAVRGAWLEVACKHGSSLVAARGGGADLDLCTVRQLAFATSCPARKNLSDYVDHVRVCGSLTPVNGAGMYRSRTLGGEERWFATTLCPAETSSALNSLASDVDGSSGLSGSLRHDRLLRVTVVGISAEHDGAVPALEAVTEQAFATLLVDEMLAPFAYQA